MAADPRHTTVFEIERHPRDLSGTVPAEAYWMNKPGGPANTFVLGSGDKDGEATAFLQDNGAGAFVFNDNPAEEDRQLFLVTSTTVVF